MTEQDLFCDDGQKGIEDMGPGHVLGEDAPRRLIIGWIWDCLIRRIAIGVVVFSWYAMLAWLEFGGLYHAFSRHGVVDGAVAFLIPPVAWYRSIEFFWHDRHTDARWKEILSEDARAILIVSGDTAENTEFVAEIPGFTKKLRERIKHYPDVRIQELKRIIDTSWQYLNRSFTTRFAEALLYPEDEMDKERQRVTYQELSQIATEDLVRWVERQVSGFDISLALRPYGVENVIEQLSPPQRKLLHDSWKQLVSSKKEDLECLKQKVFR